MPPQQRVLLVEDSPTDALIVKHALRQHYEVHHTCSPEDAKELLRHNTYAAVITDYYLPGLTGVEFLRWIISEGMSVPVVLMSGRGDERVAAEALKLGAFDYIVKSEDNLAGLGVVLQQVLRRHELEARALLLQQIVENASDTIITMSGEGVILTANQALEPMFGYRPEEAIGRPVTFLFPGATKEFEPAAMLQSKSGAPGWQGELEGRRRDGASFPAHMSVSVLKEKAGFRRCLIGIARDVTERRELLDRLQRLSVTDNLTGLYNHRFFYDRLQYEFARARRYGFILGCIMIDVDFFKSVNDTYGHLTGDEVLKSLAEIITKATRSVDILARYGGEEFAVLLPNTDLAGTLHCAEHIWESAGNSDIMTRHGPLRLTVSAGVAALTSDMKDEADLCRRADDALLMAKRRGRNMVCVWEGTPQPKEEPRPNWAESAPEVAESVRRAIAPVRAQYVEALRVLVEGLAARAPEIKRHVDHVLTYATDIARAAGMSPEEIEAVRNAAMLHDVCKPATQQAAASAPPHRHAAEAAALIQEMRLLELEALYVRHHHEHFDGSGGPDALKGRTIPIGARVLAVANAWDAINAPQQTVDATQAAARLRQMAHSKLDPDIVDLFLKTRAAPPKP